MAAVTFVNPADSSTYTWPTNPDLDAESQGGAGFQGKQRQIERTSNTGNIGLTRQQGDDGPFIIHWQFKVYTLAHQVALWEWYKLCKKQSIYLTDFAGEQYEGQIITTQRVRVGALGGPGETAARGYYLDVAWEFDVWRFISGPLATAGVSP